MTRKQINENLATINLAGRRLDSKVTSIYYLKCPVLATKKKKWDMKETVKYDTYTESS